LTPRSIDPGGRSPAIAISSRDPPQIIAGTGAPTLRGRRLPFALTPWTAVCVIFGLVAVLLFAYHGLHYADETQSELRLIPWLRYDIREDFNYFYAGADMVWHGDAADLYPDPGERIFYPRDPIFSEPRPEYENARLLARGGYYYPPALAYLQSPLTTLSFRNAYWILTAVSLTCLLGYVAVAWRQGRQNRRDTVLDSWCPRLPPCARGPDPGPLYPNTPGCTARGFSTAARRQAAAGGPGLLVACIQTPVGNLTRHFPCNSWRMARARLYDCCWDRNLLHTLPVYRLASNYYEFVRYLADVNLKDAPHMFSWNGLLTKLNDSEVQPDGSILFYADAPSRTLVYGLLALSVLPLLVVWWSRDFLMGVAATVRERSGRQSNSPSAGKCWASITSSDFL
jgi:hypothetical protein